MNKKFSALLALVFSVLLATAQNTRLSLELSGGIPITLTSVPGKLSTFGGIGLRYNVLKDFSIQALVNAGTLTGSQSGSNTFTLPDRQSNYTGFTNDFMQYSLNGQLNLERIFGLRGALKRLNPYVVAGAGFMRSNIQARRTNDNNKTYRYTFYDAYLGIMLRYYLNPSLDLCIGSMFNFTQSGYLDGMNFDKNYDNFILNSLGIAYKFGAKTQRQHIEWNNVILKDRIYLPDIEKRNGQPIDEDGNFVVYSKDSIGKLMAYNRELLEQNGRQKQELDSMKRDMAVMKTRMDTLTEEMRKVREQNNQILERLNNQPATPPATQPAAPVKGSKGKNANAPGTNEPKQQPADVEPHLTPSAPRKPKKQHVVTINVPAEESDNDKKKEEGNTAANPAESAATNSGLNQIDGVTAPTARYNIIAGAYAGEKYAYIFRDKLRAKGFDAAIFKSDVNSKILRVCVFTTQDKAEALRMMNKIRSEVDPKAWIHVYYEK